MATIEVATHLDAPPEIVREHIQTARLLRYVNAGLLSFVPIHPPELPELWSEGEYRVALKLFGIIPMGWQIIGIEEPGPDDTWIVRDNGSGSVAKTWDHLIFVTAEGAGSRYVDRVQIDAGLLTPFVVLFAQLQYRYRQRRWRRLVREGFAYRAP